MGGPKQSVMVGGSKQSVMMGGPKQSVMMGGPKQSVVVGGPKQSVMMGGPKQSVMMGGPKQSVVAGKQSVMLGSGKQSVMLGGGAKMSVMAGSLFQAPGSPANASRRGDSSPSKSSRWNLQSPRHGASTMITSFSQQARKNSSGQSTMNSGVYPTASTSTTKETMKVAERVVKMNRTVLAVLGCLFKEEPGLQKVDYFNDSASKKLNWFSRTDEQLTLIQWAQMDYFANPLNTMFNMSNLMRAKGLGGLTSTSDSSGLEVTRLFANSADTGANVSKVSSETGVLNSATLQATQANIPSSSSASSGVAQKSSDNKSFNAGGLNLADYYLSGNKSTSSSTTSNSFNQMQYSTVLKQQSKIVQHAVDQSTNNDMALDGLHHLTSEAGCDFLLSEGFCDLTRMLNPNETLTDLTTQNMESFLLRWINFQLEGIYGKKVENFSGDLMDGKALYLL